MLRVTKLFAEFSMRLKGPASHRLALKEGRHIVEPKIQDHFSEYYTQTLELYKSNFTQEELENASEPIKRVFSLRNATPTEILKFRISQAVRKYQTSFDDHGSAGVQCASMSQRIILLMMHVKKYHKDTKAARYLSRLIDQRRHMLHYLMSRDYHRYQWICTDYGIPQIHPRNAHLNRNASLKANYWKVRF